jgi:hypothetical protein
MHLRRSLEFRLRREPPYRLPPSHRVGHVHSKASLRMAFVLNRPANSFKSPLFSSSSALRRLAYWPFMPPI